jgi:hypothetical protein
MPEQIIRYVGGPQKARKVNAPLILAATWQKQKPLVRALYIVEKRELNEVLLRLREEPGFSMLR